jgi:tetratricopeptide (TPR) repeat protein
VIIDDKRYTSGRIAVANLSASIDGLELRRSEGASFGELVSLSSLLFLRGDLLGRITDHDRAELVGNEAVGLSPESSGALYMRGRLASRFHKFKEACDLLGRAAAAGHSTKEIDGEKASLLQATGEYREALELREKLARDDRGIHSIGALATLLAEMGNWAAAEATYVAALESDGGISPIPCAQLLFEWGVSAMRRHGYDQAEAVFDELNDLLPAHVPGRGHRAEVAMAREEFDLATALIKPLLEIADDPEYRATYAEILAATGNSEGAAIEAQIAAAEYERLLARRPEAYADHAAFFFLGVGNRPERALELASANWELRDTPRSRSLLREARRKAQQDSRSVGAA